MVVVVFHQRLDAGQQALVLPLVSDRRSQPNLLVQRYPGRRTTTSIRASPGRLRDTPKVRLNFPSLGCLSKVVPGRLRRDITAEFLRELQPRVIAGTIR